MANAMNKLNLGCGPDVLDGFVNTDIIMGDNVFGWDATGMVPDSWLSNFDFILVNHVLCTMRPAEAKKVIENCFDMLRAGGTLQIIDVDMNKAIDSYQKGRIDDFPTIGKTIDEAFLNHVSGYGTRLSLYTVGHLRQTLEDIGFQVTYSLDGSEYDLRPVESLVVEGWK